eukprot:TRINITY_DN5294_c0_g1_i1.p1 TRINITY_DN5294_c0_g1~~TRINITY_DN5294_c0_g1_i1.p1  ORF type:complete len:443 (-),score=57.79 TRINITY_DN5294_c0_g1_i1:21-1349(-)
MEKICGRFKMVAVFKMVAFTPDEKKASLEEEHCARCQDKFGFLFGASKDLCPTCNDAICSKCKVNYTMSSENDASMKVCKKCHHYLTHLTEKGKFKKLVDDSKDDRFSRFFSVLMDLNKHIQRDMPQFQGIVLSLTLNGEISDISDTLLVELILNVREENLISFKDQGLLISQRINANVSQIKKVLGIMDKIPLLKVPPYDAILNKIKYTEGIFLDSLFDYKHYYMYFTQVVNSPLVNDAIKKYQIKKANEEKSRLLKQKVEQHNQSFKNDHLHNNDSKSDTSLPPITSAFEEHMVKSSQSSPSISSTIMDLKTNGKATIKNALKARLPSFLQKDRSHNESLDQLVITSVRPVMIPVTGNIQLTIQGTNFKQGATVYIENKKVDAKNYGNPSELYINTPPLAEPGFKAIRVVNPDGSEFTLENVLVYSDDPTLAESFLQKKL